jgi:predicted RNA binding protein YcfA (HicA-like mRNA interferase family)
MGRKEKLLRAIRNNPTNVRFEDLRKILESIGYTAINRGGSHYVFTQEGCETLTIPYRRPVKVIYVKHVVKLIEEHENEK